MQRGSDKHGPRQDEAMGHEVEGMLRAGRSTRSEEWRDAEPSGEGDPDVDRVPDGTLEGGTPAGMDEGDVSGRAELAAALGRCYPADRDTLLGVAEQNNAPAAVLDQLRSLPAGQTFENVNHVWSTLGHGVEQNRF